MRSVRSLVLGAVAAAALAAAPAANAATCVAGKDETALQTRVVQTELMVAALSCNQTENYNSFVRMHQKELMRAHERLRGLFRKVYGRSGGDKLNEFITRLANESSQRSLSDVKAFCAGAKTMYAAALATDPKQLATFVSGQPVGRFHGFDTCSQTAGASKDAIPTPKPKPAAIAALTVPAAAPEPAEAP